MLGTLRLVRPQLAENTTRMRNALLRWYRATARSFPWRTEVPDPYVVLVSECMLQQTQAKRIAERLPEFLTLFPTIQHLAAAGNADIIRAWHGLGYNSRALRLRDAARTVVDVFGGRVPSTVEELERLPGIGPYTASAVACFGYGIRTVVLDVNVRRVYSRLLFRQNTTSGVLPDSELQAFANTIIPVKEPALWHHAIMDLGATLCNARSPLCLQCPLHTYCPSKGAMVYVPREKKSEPMFRGEPNRIWRGRMVSMLRQQPTFDSEEELFRAVTRTSFATQCEREWMHAVVTALRKDKVVDKNDLRLAD